mmetsp:Transcript_71307/g.192031  ORF Transcript_71307/g.192031 Transcript_71307/m.192031 type:complete len:221 (-) Transcript_71307:106-768(-)
MALQSCRSQSGPCSSCWRCVFYDCDNADSEGHIVIDTEVADRLQALELCIRPQVEEQSRGHCVRTSRTLVNRDTHVRGNAAKHHFPPGTPFQQVTTKEARRAQHGGCHAGTLLEQCDGERTAMVGHWAPMVCEASLMGGAVNGIGTMATEDMELHTTAAFERLKYQDMDALGEGLGMDVGVQNEPGPCTSVFGMYEDMMKTISALEKDCNRMASKGSDVP